MLKLDTNPGVTGPQPSRSLGEHGRRLWSRVIAEYDVADVAGIELLNSGLPSG
jgi:hypothetical protein